MTSLRAKDILSTRPHYLSCRAFAPRTLVRHRLLYAILICIASKAGIARSKGDSLRHGSTDLKPNNGWTRRRGRCATEC